MPQSILPRPAGKSVPLFLVTKKTLRPWLKRQPAQFTQWIKAQAFEGASGSSCALPDADGKLAGFVVGLSDPPSLWDLGGLPARLPAGDYRIEWEAPVNFHEWLALGWALGAYRFTRYRAETKPTARLILSKRSDAAKISRYAEAICLARDLINTPAEDMGPAELAQSVIDTGRKFRAKISVIKGDDLLRKNYRAIHTVGRASTRAPRLVDLIWGNPKHPKITLVGKGVCFDTGGLDLKNSSGMYYMKKDMAGAASALAVARMVMEAKLPVRLRLLIPAVENVIAGNAFRPTDIIKLRNGLNVEVGNTDAEGRLILADALTEAVSEKPDLIIDFSTLTGAARTALGTELGALFCNDDKLAENLLTAARQMEDPLWRMPLYKPYERMLDSNIADVNNCSNSPYAGAITAALFLQKFIGEKQPWIHLDMMAWNLSTRPGRPEGGEAMAVRAIYKLIEMKSRKRTS